MSATFVLVHGAFANSFSFAPLQAELALLGHRSLAVDLPGHGFEATNSAHHQAPQELDQLATVPSSIAGVTLADNAARVIEVLERAREHGPVILVGHSRGGITITAVGNARPDLIDRIVYVSAWAAVDLDVGDYYAEPEMADADAAALAGAMVGNPAHLESPALAGPPTPGRRAARRTDHLVSEMAGGYALSHLPRQPAGA